MKTFRSIYLNNTNTPDDCLVYDALIDVGYDGFIPKSFIADLLIVGYYKMMRIPLPEEYLQIPYISAIHKIIESVNLVYWVHDVMQLVKRISQKHDLRTIEAFANKGYEFALSDIDFSFNYSFDIKSIDTNVQKLLNITKDQYNEIERLPEDVIEILTIANGLGSFLNTSRQIVSGTRQMSTYGEVTKIHKHLYSDPLFKYKFSIKAYDIDIDTIVQRRSNKIVIGYYFGNYERQGLIGLLIKLLGTIVLNNFTDGIKILLYSFYMDTYSKKELLSIDEVIDYFSSPKQLKLFSINNSKALEVMVRENPGDDVIFLPNILNSCYISSNLSGSNSVNIISVSECKFNLDYSNVCKKTGGTFLTL